MSQLERLSFIDSRIKARGGVSLREVAERFEISARQARRDLDYLCERLGAPIHWSPGPRRYEYTEAWSGLEFADEKALLFYVFARAAAGTLAYVPLAEEEALARLLDFVPPALRGAESAISYELPGYDPADMERLGLIVRGIAEARCLDIAYRDAEGRASERRVEALRLVNYAGSWYCVAFDHESGELRTFRLSRFSGIAISRDRAGASVPAAELERFLSSSFGMFKGPGDKRAIVRFHGRALAVVRGEVWHPGQERSEGVDERGPYVELALPVSRYDELLGRILRFGADAEPVEPPELRELWKAEIRRMAQAVADT